MTTNSVQIFRPLNPIYNQTKAAGGSLLLGWSDKGNVLSDYLRNLGRKGGKALAKKLTPECSEKTRKAAQARWAEKGEAK